MRKKTHQPKRWIERRTPKGFHGYPIATIALYGPTAERATKIAVAIFRSEKDDPDLLERWYSASSEVDVREDASIGDQVVAFISKHGVRSAIATDRVIGCPHEEGIDYPAGSSCPQCPYWAGRDRFTGERIN